MASKYSNRSEGTSSHKTVAGWVSGHVQGVSYRASMQQEANALGLSGWVQNLPDRRVAFTIKGDPAAIDALMRWAQQGPRFARVDTVHVEPASDVVSYVGFEIRY